MKSLKVLTTSMLLCCATLQAQEKEITITVSNQWEQAKENEPIVLDIHKLNPKFPVKSAIITDGNNEIPSQLDDLNGDLINDELAFILDMPAQSTKKIKIKLSAEKSQKNYPAQVYAEMLMSDKKKKYPHIQSLTVPGESDVYNSLHHHGPAFESELVAYRIYFDKRQTVDIYGKRRKGFELKDTRFYPTQEQLADGYGDDVLWVGNTCGAGTLKGWENNKPSHIIPTWQTECIRSYGPIRTVVDVIDAGWKYQGNELTMTTRYILYGGHRDVQVNVFFEEPLKKETFCIGVINVKDSEHFTDHKGLIGCWGSDWPAGAKDTLNRVRETVGLAACIPSQYVQEEKLDAENLLYVVGAPNKKQLTYHISFASLKEEFGYKSKEEWFRYMQQWKKELEHPCSIKISKRK